MSMELWRLQAFLGLNNLLVLEGTCTVLYLYCHTIKPIYFFLTSGVKAIHQSLGSGARQSHRLYLGNPPPESVTNYLAR